ncbi:hypothetical protein [Streptomyces indicus]|uniref:Uncharacterized protein n=1 Tax=Streptomyces indicus TaxID=417292 RepID=A0A1G9K0C8_9ACTN|nr:hypothetical protein [Streptomyces indicus]SDL42755.1 hypothetical protein SAMN05421806_1393 [Streptomyces indicus]
MLLAAEAALMTGQAGATSAVQPAATSTTEAQRPADVRTVEPDLTWAQKHSKGGIPWGLAEAKKTGKRTLVPNATTPTNLTYANPDGTLTSEVTTGPERIERDGKWVDVDATLTTTADGGVRAKAHPEGLTLAARGAALPHAHCGRPRMRPDVTWSPWAVARRR